MALSTKEGITSIQCEEHFVPMEFGRLFVAHLARWKAQPQKLLLLFFLPHGGFVQRRVGKRMEETSVSCLRIYVKTMSSGI